MSNRIKLNAAGTIIEYGSIADGVEYNLTTPTLYDFVQANEPAGATTGAGSPEGVVTTRHANDMYQNSSDGHVWVHAADAGNTGWVDATGAAAPGGPSVLGAVSISTTGLVNGSLLKWDATNQRLQLLTPATAITAPTAPSVAYDQAEAAAMKTAVDAIRAALIAAKITL